MIMIFKPCEGYLEMSQLWNFSKSSEVLLRKCLEAAAKNQTPNKWTQVFSTSNLENNIPKVQDTEIIPIKEYPEINKTVDKSTANVTNYEDVLELLETEAILNLNYMIDNCVRIEILLIELAEKLPESIVLQISSAIFNRTDINSHFLLKFYEHFLPLFFVRTTNIISLDLLIMARNYNQSLFKILISSILRNAKIASQLVLDYFNTLSSDDQNELLTLVATVPLKLEDFNNNLYTIYSMYKECKKSDMLQNYVWDNLRSFSISLPNDRNIGRLILEFVKSLVQFPINIDYSELEKAVDTHSSPFRQPCLAAMSVLKDTYNVSNLSCLNS